MESQSRRNGVFISPMQGTAWLRDPTDGILRLMLDGVGRKDWISTANKTWPAVPAEHVQTGHPGVGNQHDPWW